MCLQQLEDKEIVGGPQYYDFYWPSLGADDGVTHFSSLLDQPAGLGLPVQASHLKSRWSLEADIGPHFIRKPVYPGKCVIHKVLHLLLIPSEVTITGLLITQTPLPQV
jgi:hypothetical protein